MMPDGSSPYRLTLHDSIAAIPASSWDACAGADNPFVGHAFLLALEESRSAVRDSGWLPQHALVEDEAGNVLGVAPMYLKSHSYGEYVFDHGWADAYMRAGGRYYPKLQVSVPFTPVPGPRLMLHPEANPALFDLLAKGLIDAAFQRGVSSLHITFAGQEECERLSELGFLQRQGYQFHWSNRGYASFEDFLKDLSSRKRKSIRKERRDVVDSGVEIHTLSGSAVEPRHWDAFFRFYRSTSDRKWGQPYLTRGFFDRIGASMADKIVLVLAEHKGKFVAGALNLKGSDTLYGRNWGCLGDYPFLHFEACYYRAIDYAIEHGLARVEAGAQGEHKLQRGYLPSPTHSAHWIREPSFRQAVDDYLCRERLHIARTIEALGEHSPFRQENEAAES
jgi:predicted N-acyltransferase